MQFVNTQPSALENPADMDTWMTFRVEDPRARLAILRELARGELPMVIGATGEASFVASLWSVQTEADRLHWRVEPEANDPAPALEAQRLWAAAYLDSHKVQFVLRSVLLRAAAPGQWTFQSALPLDLYRMPRRRELRMRRDLHQAPKARLHGLGGAAGEPSHVVLDVSRGGCALFLPPSGPELQAGTRLPQVELELDDVTFIFADLVVQNVQRSARGSQRVGCRFEHMPATGRAELERWLAGGRVRRVSLQLVLD